MKIRITGRHIDLTEDIREFMVKRIEKLETFYDKILEARVVLEFEDNRYLTDITLKTQKTQLHAEDEDYGLFASINATMEKIERQTRRRKERVKDQKHKTSRREVAAQLGEKESENVEYFEEETSSSIVKVDGKFAPKPISVQEAAMELKLSEDNFLMFMNAETKQINLLYVQDDGNYGWVEPEFS